MKKFLYLLVAIATLLSASTQAQPITLSEALDILSSKNLEIKAALFDESMAKKDVDAVWGKNFGKLTFTQDVANSNDAGNVFGFKLSSREATFGDFGFGAPNMPTNQNSPAYLTTPPSTLNYPDSREYYQSKLKYEVPLFTGFQLTNYEHIMKEVAKIKGLDKQKMINEKKYELKKTFYDVALVQKSAKELHKILDNINTLMNMTQAMIDEGYAKHVDLLEVKAKKANVQRLLIQMDSNEQLLYHYLSFLLNQNVTSIITPKNDLIPTTLSDKEIIDRNLDIQKAKNGLRVKKDMVGVSQSAFYPTIGAFAEVSTADNTFLGDADKHKAYSVGARLTWNLFSGNTDSANMQKARLEEMKTATQVELAKRGIALKISKIKTEILEYTAEIKSLEQELLLANTIYANYEGRYKEKLVSMSDVIIKQSQQIEKILKLQQIKNKRNERILALENLANKE